jgi:hypothetical protein
MRSEIRAAADDDGAGLADIGEAVELTKARVHQIVRQGG